MPTPEMFIGTATSSPTEAYHAVLSHECVHWSGAGHRLNREFGKRFGDRAYAFEELVAELGAAFMCSAFRITNEPRPDHAAYVSSWIDILNRDTKAVFTAASKAQEAVEYLMQIASATAAPWFIRVPSKPRSHRGFSKEPQLSTHNIVQDNGRVTPCSIANLADFIIHFGFPLIITFLLISFIAFLVSSVRSKSIANVAASNAVKYAAMKRVFLPVVVFSLCIALLARLDITNAAS
jgi:hypothetical protein